MTRIFVICACLLGIPFAKGSIIQDDTDQLQNVRSARSSLTKRLLDRDPVMALSHATEALYNAERTQNNAAIHVALVNKAAEEKEIGLDIEFLETAKRAIEIASSIGDPVMIVSDLQNLSTAYTANDQKAKAANEAKTALAMAQQTQDEETIRVAEIFLIRSLAANNQVEDAMALAQNSRDRMARTGNELAVQRNELLIAQLLMQMDEPRKAASILAEVTKELDVIGSTNDRITSRMALCDAYLKLDQVESAASTLQEATAQVSGLELNGFQQEILDRSYAIALKRGQWQQALQFLQAIQHQRDSIFAAHTELKMASLQALYLSDATEKDNEDLRNSNARKEEIITGQKLSNRFLMGVAAVGLIIMLALIYTGRTSLFLVKRLKQNNKLIKGQHDEIEQKNLELQEQNRRLAASLISAEEKEIMIKEIHHRVKNNLQVMESLITVECAGLNDQKLTRILKEAKGRIRAMAAVHDSAYGRAIVHGQNTQHHFETLARNILVSHGVHDKVSVIVNADQLLFDDDVLMPLSLLVNELVTRSVNSAFEGQDTGHLYITLRDQGGEHELIFKDNCTKTPLSKADRASNMFSDELLRSLTTQLHGELRPLDEKGTGYRLTFRQATESLRLAS